MGLISSEKLKSISEQRRKLGLPADYDRSCAGIPKDESDVRAANGEPYVVRLKSRPKYPPFRDLVVGTVKPSPATKYRDGLPSYDDPILFKSDGMPTYHFANVVDDHLMKITHVVRASEWISSTSKHIHIYEAFGWQPPEFAHVSILTDTSRQKLSKRNLEASNMNWYIDGYRDSGVLPAALVNFVSLLGWSHDKKKDMMSMKELIENFDLRFTKGDTIVTFPKLWYLQGQHSARMAEEGGEDFERFVDQVYTSARQHPIMVEGVKSMGIARPRDYIGSVLRIDAPNYTTSEQFLQRNAYFFRRPSNLSPYRSQADEHSHAVSTLVAKAAELSVIPESDWTEKQIAVALNKIMKDVTGATNEAMVRDGSGKLKEARRTWNTAFYQYLRWAITGELVGPPIPQIMEVLGYTVCMQRLDRGAEMVKSTSENGKIGTQLESKVQA
ncbi:MAG: hypothetical protein M1825_003233 [Sarcosagium campestre]|nr:MAG: hypothetical protein M1825_003233 [Sarcosagium campestre]